MKPIPDARMRVVCFLQAKLRAVDSDDEEIERALDMALSEKRSASTPAFLYRNAVRDAKRSVRRSRARHPTVEFTEELGLAYEDPIVDRIATRQLLRKVYDESDQLGAVFEGFLCDESVAGTADRLGLTVWKVKRLRTQSMQLARKLAA